MEQIRRAIHSMIEISGKEIDALLGRCELRTGAKGAALSLPGEVPNEVLFINKGLLRVLITDVNEAEHTVHFALENQFIADYSSFILQQPSHYTLQALEPMELVVLPRHAVEWGYACLAQGEKLGRLIAEYYFIYQDHRIKNLYSRSPIERYEAITEVFPNIHNRAPQHMIASYLGMTPVHLSRLKSAAMRQAVR